jgi:hypothetical protein
VAAKAALAESVRLIHPSPGAEISLLVDASAEHIGAALRQRPHPAAPWRPLGFFSRKLDAMQVKYSAFDKELLACVSGFRHFRYMLEGCQFTIYTDHKPLTYALSRTSDPWSARQARQLSYLAEHTTDIRHIAGEENVVAGTLSRPPSSAAVNVKEPSGLWGRLAGRQARIVFTVHGPAHSLRSLGDSAEVGFRRHQKMCQATLQASKSSSFQPQAVEVMGVSLWCDVSTGVPRPVIPVPEFIDPVSTKTSPKRSFSVIQNERFGHVFAKTGSIISGTVEDMRTVFNAFHGLAHAGACATRHLLAARVVWRSMNSDVAAWITDCQQCCRGKVTSQPAAPVQLIYVPAKRFNHVHIDLVGPLPVAKDGSTYLLTMVDRTTRWLEAVPLRSMEAAACANAFIGTWVACYGVPAVVTTDRGRQFTSGVWVALCQRLNFDHITTTSNGMIERTHRQLKDALRSRLAGPQWPEHLPWLLMGLRAAPKEESALSSTELVFGAPLTLPGHLLSTPETPVKEVVEAMRSMQPPPHVADLLCRSSLWPPAPTTG